MKIRKGIKRNRDGRVLAMVRKKYGKPIYPENRAVSKEQKSEINEKMYADTAWQQIKKSIKDDINQLSYEVWIDPCKPVSMENNEMTLCVENYLIVEILKNRYHQRLENIAKEVLHKPIKISFVVSCTRKDGLASYNETH